MSFAGQFFASNVKFEQELHVDPVIGDDATGERSNLGKPYATIAAAFLDYQLGDIIIVHPGRLTDANVFLSGIARVDIFFMEGAEMIVADVNGYCFQNNVSSTYHIWGRGVFRTTNASNTNGPFIGNDSFAIHGAKEITSDDGPCIGTRCSIVENVDLIESQQDAAINWTVPSPSIPRNGGRTGGIIRNLKLVRGTIGMNLTNPGNEDIIVENCNFQGTTTYAYASSGFTHAATFVNCTFRNDASRAVYVNGYNRFRGCRFQGGHASTEIMWIDDTNLPADRKNPRPTFYDCDWLAQGGGAGIRLQGAITFAGLCRIFSPTPFISYIENENIVTGLLEINNDASNLGAQFYNFQLNEDPPTVGQAYTITAPDGSSISYTVLALDTRVEIVDGLIAAWLAESAAEPTGDFNKYTPSAQYGPPAWRVRAVAKDSDYNFDPSDAWVIDAGSDAFANLAVMTNGFAHKGNGNVVVRDDLQVQIIQD